MWHRVPVLNVVLLVGVTCLLLGLVLTLTPAPGVVLLLPGVALTAAASVVLLARRREEG